MAPKNRPKAGGGFGSSRGGQGGASRFKVGGGNKSGGNSTDNSRRTSRSSSKRSRSDDSDDEDYGRESTAAASSYSHVGHQYGGNDASDGQPTGWARHEPQLPYVYPPTYASAAGAYPHHPVAGVALPPYAIVPTAAVHAPPTAAAPYAPPFVSGATSYANPYGHRNASANPPTHPPSSAATIAVGTAVSASGGASTAAGTEFDSSALPPAVPTAGGVLPTPFQFPASTPLPATGAARKLPMLPTAVAFMPVQPQPSASEPSQTTAAVPPRPPATGGSSPTAPNTAPPRPKIVLRMKKAPPTPSYGTVNGAPPPAPVASHFVGGVATPSASPAPSSDHASVGAHSSGGGSVGYSASSGNSSAEPHQSRHSSGGSAQAPQHLLKGGITVANLGGGRRAFLDGDDDDDGSPAPPPVPAGLRRRPYSSAYAEADDSSSGSDSDGATVGGGVTTASTDAVVRRPPMGRSEHEELLGSPVNVANMSSTEAAENVVAGTSAASAHAPNTNQRQQQQQQQQPLHQEDRSARYPKDYLWTCPLSEFPTDLDICPQRGFPHHASPPHDDCSSSSGFGDEGGGGGAGGHFDENGTFIRHFGSPPTSPNSAFANSGNGYAYGTRGRCPFTLHTPNDILYALVERLPYEYLSRNRHAATIPERLIRAILLRAREVLMAEPLVLQLPAPMNICGDIHGQFEDLLNMFAREPPLGGRVLKAFAKPPPSTVSKPTTPTVPKPAANANGDTAGGAATASSANGNADGGGGKSGPTTRPYLFLGDYVDRGLFSLEVVVMLFALKILSPTEVHLLRGNHESAAISKRYGFFDECKRRYVAGPSLWKLCMDVFMCLPVSAIVGEAIFCAHGGISPELESVQQLIACPDPRPFDTPAAGVFCDLLWSDPVADPSTTYGWTPSERGVSYCWGADVLELFLERNGLDLLCRGHQVMEEGYGFFPYYGGGGSMGGSGAVNPSRRAVTVFSASDYGGDFGNCAAMMTVGPDLRCGFHVFRYPSIEVRRILRQGITDGDIAPALKKVMAIAYTEPLAAAAAVAGEGAAEGAADASNAVGGAAATAETDAATAVAVAASLKNSPLLATAVKPPTPAAVAPPAHPTIILPASPVISGLPSHVGNPPDNDDGAAGLAVGKAEGSVDDALSAADSESTVGATTPTVQDGSSSDDE